MPKSRDYVFVLWNDGFDEMAAIAFVTQLREAGLLVKVVGLNLKQIVGAHGLALVPDLTMDQALLLASQAIGVIIPTARDSSRGFSNDPRLRQFFELASSNQAKFFSGGWAKTRPAGLDLPASVEGKITIYPEDEDIVKFARQIAAQLSRRVL